MLLFVTAAGFAFFVGFASAGIAEGVSAARIGLRCGAAAFALLAFIDMSLRENR